MGYGSKSKLTSKEQYEFILDLCRAIVAARNIKDAAHLLQDLLTPNEAVMIAKRLKIAQLLLSGVKFQEISTTLRAGVGTISRVNKWLNLSGRGYRLALNNRVKSPPGEARQALEEYWRLLKNRYPLYMWPEMLIEEAVKKASKKQRRNIIDIIKKFDEKEEKQESF